MSVKVVKDVLVKALATSTQAASNNTVIPYLNNSRLQAVKATNALVLSTTNMEVEILATAKAVLVGEEWDIAVPTTLFDNLIKSMPDDILTLELDTISQHLKLSGTRSNHKLKYLSPQDFPVFQWPNIENTLDVDAAVLASLMRNALVSVSTDPLHNESPLGCMFLEFNGDTLLAAGVNGFRYSLASESMGGKLPFTALIPYHSVGIVTKSIKGDIHVTQQGSKAYFIGDDVNVSCLMNGGKFPDYKLFPKSTGPWQVNVPSSELMAALKQAAVLADKAKPKVNITVGQLLMEISVPENQSGSSIMHVPVEYVSRGDSPLEIKFDVAYMMDALSVIEGSTVSIFLKDARSPGMFYGDKENVFHGILPIAKV